MCCLSISGSVSRSDPPSEVWVEPPLLLVFNYSLASDSHPPHQTSVFRKACSGNAQCAFMRISTSKHIDTHQHVLIIKNHRCFVTPVCGSYRRARHPLAWLCHSLHNVTQRGWVSGCKPADKMSLSDILGMRSGWLHMALCVDLNHQLQLGRRVQHVFVEKPLFWRGGVHTNRLEQPACLSSSAKVMYSESYRHHACDVISICLLF